MDAQEIAAPPAPATAAISIPEDHIGGATGDDIRSHDFIVESRMQDIARRAFLGMTITSIAEATGLSRNSVERYMASPRFVEIYGRVTDDVYDHFDDTLKNEKVELAMRQGVLARRSLTALAEAIEAAREHVRTHGGNSKSTMVRALVDGAVAGLDRDPGTVQQAQAARAGAAAASPRAGVVLNINTDKAAIIAGALRESGVDLSDILRELPKREAPAALAPAIDVEEAP